MREDVGEVLHPPAGLCLEPGSCGSMLSCAAGPRDLAVRDVPDEHVPERVLGLALHRCPTGRPDELLARELVERELDFAPVAPTHRGQRAGPEDLPEDRRVLQKAL